MALKFGLNASFHNMYDSKGIREKAEEVSGTKAYTTTDETSSWILNGWYAIIGIVFVPLTTTPTAETTAETSNDRTIHE
jgi:hypothetical protein